jgi:ubiquinone/menaquinone biosynthesis C-methylase UbiE
MDHRPEAVARSAAEAYEDFMVRWQFRPWTAVLLAEAALDRGERVLDLATGTGIVAREAAPLVGTDGCVLALDVNPAMLAVGQGLPRPAGSAIAWREGDAVQLPLPDANFAAVLCQQGLQYFSDRPAAVAEMRRVLVTGGRVVAAVWRGLEHNPVQAVVNEAGLRRFAVQLLATAFSLGDARMVRALFEDAGFDPVTITPRELVVVFPSRAAFVHRLVESLTGVAPELAGLDTVAQAELARAIDDDVGAALAAHRWGAGIAASMSAHLIEARSGES